jgi:hypothetical protein
VSTLLSTYQQDIRSLAPDHLAAMTTFAQQTEADTYNTATSYEDYFQRLAERIFEIDKDYKEKQILKQQSTATATVPTTATTTTTTTTTPTTAAAISSIDKSAGELGPPNRTAPPSDCSSSFSSLEKKSEPIDNYSVVSSMSTDRQRTSVNTVNQVTSQTNNVNGQLHVETNGNHIDMNTIKAERISPRIDTNHQVRMMIDLSAFIEILSFVYGHDRCSSYCCDSSEIAVYFRCQRASCDRDELIELEEPYVMNSSFSRRMN